MRGGSRILHITLNARQGAELMYWHKGSNKERARQCSFNSHILASELPACSITSHISLMYINIYIFLLFKYMQIQISPSAYSEKPQGNITCY